MVYTHLRCALVACHAKQFSQDRHTQTAQELLKAVWNAWNALTLPKATGQTVAYPGAGLDLESLSRKFLELHWPSGEAFAYPAEKAFDLLREHLQDTPLQIPIMSTHPVAFLRDLTACFMEGSRRRKDTVMIRVPFLLVRRGDPAAAFAWFVFERLPNGQGDVFLAPEQAFLPAMDANFGRVFSIVPNVVRQYLSRPEQDAKFFHHDIRIWIEQPGGDLWGEPLAGSSVTGAAAWGLYFTWTGKVPDEGIIVMAQLNDDSSLSGVEGVEAKTRALADDGCFDTIVVASKDNCDEARETLDKLGKLGPIRVVNLECQQHLEICSTSTRCDQTGNA